MKQIAQTILIGLLLCVIGMPKGYAYDFSAVCETGQTLYYNITNAEYHYVTLTYPGNPEYGSYGWDGFEKPIGNIVLPKYVYDADGNRYIVTSISDFAFYNCSGLTGNLTIPDFVASIGNSAFSGCSGFTGSLTISNSVNLIGNYAFHDCSGFTGNLTIPNSVITIGYEAFSSCRSFTGTLIIPNSVFSIGARAFYKCSQLSSVILSNSLNTISPYLFCECSRLVSVTIPNSVNSIEELAFSFCGQLQHIEIPNSVVSIAQNAFICSELEQIVVASDNPEFDSRDNCNAIIKTNTNELFIGCKRSTIPNTVTSIADNAFFQNAYGLTSIIIPNSVVSIGEGAFAYCRNLFTVNIPNSVISIGADAFFGCGLTSITLGNAVDSIGDYAFCDCQNLSSVYYTGTLNQWCEISFSNDESNPLYYGHNLYINNALVTEVVIPETMNSIGNNVFCGGSCIESITIGNSVESIGNCAFENCTGLTSLFIPNSVISIGFNAFSGCSGLVGPLVIPNALTLIDYGVFKGCDGLTGELVIPNSVTEIGWHAFEGCGGLTSLTIPNSVTKIGWCTFEGCSGLTSLTIPNSVTEIGWHAFKNCSGLTSVTLLCITPPAPTSDSYETFDGSNCPIYVPYESLNDYKTVPNWSDYENRFQPMAYKTIPGYGEGEGNYRFVASPLAGNTDPTTVDNMITESEYDLYRFDQSEEAEWRNYKANNFNLINGQGYLYANSEDVNLIFKGTFNENSTKTIDLIYEAGEPFAGWNLVGNPFPVAATVTGSSYYVLNEEGTGLDPIPVSSGGTIPACTGIMVHATVLGQPVTFSTSTPETQSQNNGMLQIAVVGNTRGNAIEDRAVISFNEGDALGKFVFNKNNAQISIPQGGEDYAIACAEKRGEMLLNFKAAKNGSYTLTINSEAVEMEYLHLVDNLTGNDIDLLVTPSYTFEGKTSDYASRFRLVFSVYEDVDGDNEEPFAFISDGSIIVTGDYANAMLQIVDLTGRIVVSTEVANNVSVNELSSGVYVLRLINGENVRTQKIVIH